MEEIWKNVVGFEFCYEVSNLGNIRSKNRLIAHPKGGTRQLLGKVMNPFTDRDGYKRLKLCFDGQCSKHYVHNLVMATFVGPKPEGMATAHGNGIPDDNRLENLRYATFKENEADKIIHDRHVRGERNANNNLTTEQIYLIRRTYDWYMKNHKHSKMKRDLHELAEKLGMPKSSIYQIGLRVSWAWLPEEVEE